MKESFLCYKDNLKEVISKMKYEKSKEIEKIDNDFYRITYYIF